MVNGRSSHHDIDSIKAVADGDGVNGRTIVANVRWEI